LQAIQRHLGNLAIISQVGDSVWIGANIVEFLEAGVGLCGPGVVAVAVHRALLLYVQKGAEVLAEA